MREAKEKIVVVHRPDATIVEANDWALQTYGTPGGAHRQVDASLHRARRVVPVGEVARLLERRMATAPSRASIAGATGWSSLWR